MSSRKRYGFIQKIFNKTDPNMPAILILLSIVAFFSIVFAIGIGPVSVTPSNVAKIILSRIPFLTDSIPKTWEQLDDISD